MSEKRWIDAKEMYTKSIAVVYAKEDKWEKPEDLKAEEKLLRQMEEVSHNNRALCNLELGMFSFLLGSFRIATYMNSCCR